MNRPRMGGPLADRLAIFVAAALFSTGGVAIKGVAVGAWQVAGLRALLAALAVSVIVPGRIAKPRGAVLVAGAAQGATMLLFVLANRTTTAANAIFLQSAAPLYIPLLAARVLDERATRRDYASMAGIAFGLSLFFVATAEATATAPQPLLGDCIAVASGVTWAGTIVGLRYLARAGAMAEGAAKGALVWGNLMVAAVALAIASPLQSGSASDWGILVYLGVFQVALAYRFLVRAVARVPALEASLLALFEPVLNPVWAFLLLGERPSQWALAGAAVLASVTTARAIAGSRPLEPASAKKRSAVPRAPGSD